MIKAETIVHEGNPGPNWLDHCRTILTPIKVTSLIVLVTAGFITTNLITRGSQAATANQVSYPLTSQQADTADNLQVVASFNGSVSQAAVTNSSGATAQMAATAANAAIQPTAAKSAGRSSALVSTSTSSATNTPHTNPLQPVAQSLQATTQTAQNGVQALQSTVEQTLQSLPVHL